MPGGISEKEIKDTFISFYENKDVIIKKLFKDCVMIDKK